MRSSQGGDWLTAGHQQWALGPAGGAGWYRQQEQLPQCPSLQTPSPTSPSLPWPFFITDPHWKLLGSTSAILRGLSLGSHPRPVE